VVRGVRGGTLGLLVVLRQEEEEKKDFRVALARCDWRLLMWWA
jgi:hypothetical protein